MVNTGKLTFYPQLQAYAEDLLRETGLIPEERRDLLSRLADYIARKKGEGLPVALNFICTHNSRRSHIGQLWAAAAAFYFGLDDVTAFSGGTEATAFHPRAVAAMERAGFRVESPGGINPHYLVSFAQNGPPVECFSKTYDDPVNPRTGFGAIMTCAQAEENCPYLPGAEFRLSLTYEDPREADDRPREAETYDDRVRQIGRELFHAMRLAAASIR